MTLDNTILSLAAIYHERLAMSTISARIYSIGRRNLTVNAVYILTRRRIINGHYRVRATRDQSPNKNMFSQFLLRFLMGFLIR